MSIHRSLKVKEGLMRSRNVWTRFERLEALKKAKKLDEGESVFGLPKVRTGARVRKKVKEKKVAAVVAGAPGEAVAVEAGAKPELGKAGAKGPAKAAPVAAAGKGGPAKAAPSAKPAGGRK